MSTKKGSRQLTNWYSKIHDSGDKKRYDYPNKKNINIELPARFLLTGLTGSGKTTTLLEIIQQVNHFDFVAIIAKKIEEPLYQLLKSKYESVARTAGLDPADMFLLSNSLSELPTDYSEHNCSLVVIDDFMNSTAKELKPVLDLWIAGRKEGVSMCWLTQSYFKTLTTIRENCQYFIFKQLTNKKNTKRILDDLALDVPVDEVIKMYKKVTEPEGLSRDQAKLRFFMIDTQTMDPSLRYRDCFWPID